MTDWVRLWHDMPTDPKWRVVAKRAGQSIAEAIAVFNFVLVNASANASERGRTDNLHAEDIAAALDMETEQIEAILAAMQGKVLNGEHLTGWEKRQPKREDNSAERAKAWRERNRTQSNAPKRPETETETEKNKKDAVSDETGGEPPRIVEVPAPDPETMEAQVYRLGKKVLGPNSGGMITKLHKHFGRDWLDVREALQLAATKGDPREYVAGILKPPEDPMDRVFAGAL